jgi:hypothetical protein
MSEGVVEGVVIKVFLQACGFRGLARALMSEN